MDAADLCDIYNLNMPEHKAENTADMQLEVFENLVMGGRSNTPASAAESDRQSQISAAASQMSRDGGGGDDDGDDDAFPIQHHSGSPSPSLANLLDLPPLPLTIPDTMPPSPRPYAQQPPRQQPIPPRQYGQPQLQNQRQPSPPLQQTVHKTPSPTRGMAMSVARSGISANDSRDDSISVPSDHTGASVRSAAVTTMTETRPDPSTSAKNSTVLINDIIREMHKDVVHSDFGEKITIIYDIDREIGRLSKLKVTYTTLEKPSESMSVNALQQLLQRYKAIRLNAGVEEFSTETHIAGAIALEKIFNGKRQIFGSTPCLKGFSGRIGTLMTNTNIDSAAIFKRILRAIGLFNDEGLTALGIVNAVCLTLADNGINTEKDVKSISR